MSKILFFLLITVTTFSQNAVITYEAILSDNHRLFIQNNPIYRAAFEVSPDNNYVLTIKNNKTLFELEKSLSFEDIKYKSAAILAGYINPVYQDLEESKYYYSPSETPFFRKDDLLIKEPILNDWEIQNETKKIDRFLCYKAILEIQIFDVIKDDNYLLKIEESTTTITAWFTPDIPINSGPLGYGNLPGLILELHSEDKVVFGVKSLDLNLDSVDNFSKPIAKSEVSFKDYLEIFLSNMK